MPLPIFEADWTKEEQAFLIVKRISWAVINFDKHIVTITQTSTAGRSTDFGWSIPPLTHRHSIWSPSANEVVLMDDGHHLASQQSLGAQHNSLGGVIDRDTIQNSCISLENGRQAQRCVIPFGSQWVIPPPTYVKPNAYTSREYLTQHGILDELDTSTDQALTPSSVSNLSYSSSFSSSSTGNGSPTSGSSIPNASPYNCVVSGSYESNGVPASTTYGDTLSASQTDSTTALFHSASDPTVPIQTSTLLPQISENPSSSGLERNLPLCSPSSQAEPYNGMYATFSAIATHELPSATVDDTTTHVTSAGSQVVHDLEDALMRRLAQNYLRLMKPMSKSSSSRVSRTDLLYNTVSAFPSPSEEMVPPPSFESTGDTAAVAVSRPQVFSLPPRIKRSSKNVSRNLQSMDRGNVLSNDSSGIQSPAADEVPIPAPCFTSEQKSTMCTSSWPGLQNILASHQVMGDYTRSPSANEVPIPSPNFSSENKSTVEASQPYSPFASAQVMGRHTRAPALQISENGSTTQVVNPRFTKGKKKVMEQISNKPSEAIYQRSDEFKDPADVSSWNCDIKSFGRSQHLAGHPCNMSQADIHAINAMDDYSASIAGQSQVTPVGAPPGLRHPRWPQPAGPIAQPMELRSYPDGNCESSRCVIPVQSGETEVALSGDSDNDFPSYRLEKWLDEQQARTAGSSNGGG
ncbi:hypothetical protein C8Q75DRAFT_806260 [Abortiporus biennis]|nr:hypothetical protein C8Q75DRAFT_806260 [Abortiporus biennis]